MRSSAGSLALKSFSFEGVSRIPRAMSSAARASTALGFVPNTRIRPTFWAAMFRLLITASERVPTPKRSL